MISCEGCSNRVSRWWHCLDCNAGLCDACRALPRSPVPRHAADHLQVEYAAPAPWTTRDVRDAIVQCRQQLIDKTRRQNGVGTFFDHTLNTFLKLSLLPNGEVSEEFSGRVPFSPRAAFFIDFLRRQAQGRYVDYFARKAAPGSDLAPQVLSMSQGIGEALRWKGYSLYKSVFDLGIYQELLQALRPATLIEIGAGDGGSALWFADLLQGLGIEAQVYSMDLRIPRLDDPRITFIEGDCNEIGKAFTGLPLERWPRPWLVIEDAHVNVTGVLAFLGELLEGGDYLVVEDSGGKDNDIGRFLLPRRDDYRVDTRYTDLFGHNATSCIDSVLRRM